MTRPYVRLAFSSFFWRMFAVLAIVLEAGLWGIVGRFAPPGPQRILAWVYFSPMTLAAAFSGAAGLAVFADLWVRFVARPLILKWHNPVPDDTFMNFRLDAGEWIGASSPSRRDRGRLWPSGVLCRTNKRIVFHPADWTAETWSVSLAEILRVEARPAPRIFLGFIRDLPERLEVETRAGEIARFAVPNVDEVLDWIDPKRAEFLLPV